MDKKTYIPLIVVAGLLASFAATIPVFAQTSQAFTTNGARGAGGGRFGAQHGGQRNFAPGVFGTVTTISGTTLTVTSKARPNMGEAGARGNDYARDRLYG